MTLHTASERLVSFELSPAEDRSPDAIRLLTNAALEACGLAPWRSVELEIYEGTHGALVFAVPVKLFLPQMLLRLSEGIDRHDIM